MHRNTGDGLPAKARGRDLQPRDCLAPAPRHEADLPVMRVEGLEHQRPYLRRRAGGNLSEPRVHGGPAPLVKVERPPVARRALKRREEGVGDGRARLVPQEQVGHRP
jgi:hypothetical protein